MWLTEVLSTALDEPFKGSMIAAKVSIDAIALLFSSGFCYVLCLFARLKKCRGLGAVCFGDSSVQALAESCNVGYDLCIFDEKRSPVRMKLWM